jgi:hypothetical protein
MDERLFLCFLWVTQEDQHKQDAFQHKLQDPHIATTTYLERSMWTENVVVCWAIFNGNFILWRSKEKRLLGGREVPESK